VTWEKGRASIEALLRQGHLEQVIANPDEARHLLGRARTHLSTAAETAELDPEIAYDALYGAARKALTALLVEQGLRPTREGGHEAAIQAAEAQFVPPMGDALRPYRRLRRRRAQGDYLGAEVAIHADDVHADLPAATAIVDLADKLLATGKLTVFTPVA
jgi:HEPN domain-containing protein